MDDSIRQLIESLQARIAALEAENEQLRQKLAEVERLSNRQAGKFRRRESSKIPADQQKRPGRKAGHEGHCRAVPTQIDHTEEVPLTGCPQCGGPVEKVQRVEQYIEEIVPARPHVTRVITYEGQCPCCGEVYSTHPLQTSRGRGAAKVQLGPRALSLGAKLNKAFGLPMRKTCQVLAELAGLRLTGGGLSQALDRVARKLLPAYGALHARIRQAAAVYADETSWWVSGPGAWLWVFTTPQDTLYRIEDGRGHGVVKKVLGPDFTGILSSDCLTSYDAPPYRKQKCAAHHLRAIKKARELPKTRDPTYLDRWDTFWKQAIALYHQRPSLTEEAFAEARDQLQRECDDLLRQSPAQPGDVKIYNRLLKHRQHLLTCLYDPAVEPTNNRAEQQIRPAVVARKISCGNKTPSGAATWQVLASLAATCAQRGLSFVDFTRPHLCLAGAG